MSRERRQTLSWLVLAAVVISVLLVAVTRTEPPATEAERAYHLKETTLCPECDGQNVLESNAAVALSIRRQIDQQVAEGRTDDEIRSFLANQYGDDVNPTPPRRGFAALVWVLPVVIVAGAVAGLVVSFRRWRSGRGADVSDADRALVEAARRQQR